MVGTTPSVEISFAEEAVMPPIAQAAKGSLPTDDR